MVIPSSHGFLHASLVPAQEVVAVWTLVRDHVQRVDAAWDAGAEAKADDAQDGGEHPGHGPRLRVGGGGHLALAVRADHLHGAVTEVGRRHVLHHHSGAGASQGWAGGGGVGRSHLGVRWRRSRVAWARKEVRWVIDY